MDAKHKEPRPRKVAHGNRTDELPLRQHKQSNRKRKSSPEDSVSTITNDAPTKKQPKQAQPLKGVTVSVSTLKDHLSTSHTTSGDEDDGPSGYQEVCQICKNLGAQVTNQVSKRVQLLLCTKSAVEKSTQRVRKAFKKKIPIVDVAWLESCRKAAMSVDMEPFLLNEEAKAAIENREKNLEDGLVPAELDQNTGWTEGVTFGCSCVCHENGVERDCPWCAKGCSC